ncbi:NADP-dependent oxidoreductase [Sphingomonas sp. LB2R24]|uniref:NADP-dependent oxidoreductase n=1 Tax=Sphingomonas sorbitolis TaxID=3096165 RepID=UPI002FCBCFEC
MTMKAVALSDFGGPEVLHIVALPMPNAGPGEVRIKVAAATVNPIDTMVRRGVAFVSDAPPPYVPGMEAAGAIDQISSDAQTDLRVGDRVVAIAVISGMHGAYAEWLVVPIESVVRSPIGASDVEAATLPMNALTARQALDRLTLPVAGTVAVTGAAGAVGGYAVQIAKAEGYHVIADAAPGDEELVRGFGANVVLPRGPGFATAVRQVVPGGVDGLIDTAGIAPSVAGAVRDGGRIVTSAPGTPLVDERGIVTQRTFVPDYARNQAALLQLSNLASEGHLTLRVARTLPATDAVEAHRLLEAGGLRGRIVLTF